ncbi:hypothetical protein GCM10010168_70510 [Actinoplanes ianthinogenes]|uniref:Uncharacterized protein n=1 Tax=Actinoplanes ianthinogenes TaxID=122358 RepID=A0ABM7M703_9ACTN|nr:hypothetical protein [Actinoplanes ianthinogenes]BCJ47359.1 hypothetical protein Aiant_80160 [Actinoplanes ianthinogenes]GGR41820.1 hypothetical protein GCM10010168_70510 [Actinoplanes ianthinogenes]
MTTDEAATSVYGLRRPTMTDARDAMFRVHGHTGRSSWARLLAAAALTGAETDEAALLHLVDTMTRLDPVSRLCAQALRIRLSSYTHLAAAQLATGSPA